MSYLGSNAFRHEDNEKLGKGMIYNTLTSVWDEPNMTEEELLMGFQMGDTVPGGVTEAQRAVTLCSAMDTRTMRRLGIQASQAWGSHPT